MHLFNLNVLADHFPAITTSLQQSAQVNYRAVTEPSRQQASSGDSANVMA